MKQARHSLYKWLDERLDLTEILAFARKKTVPVHHHSFWYYWGGLSLFFFLVQALTGTLLLIYYRPGPEAYESVRQITYEIDFGWLIRSIHSWAANLMIFAAMTHMFSVFFMKAYRKPRELGWWSGLGLLGLALFFGFSGYLLPMDELSYFATKVGLEIPALIPWVGPKAAALLRGGVDVSAVTTQRFFALHAAVLPALFVPLLAFHLWLVQKHGNAVPPSEELKPPEQRRSIPFFPDFALKDLAMWLIALNLLVLLAAMFPQGLGQPADPLAPAPQGIHPEWYFMSSFQTLKMFGKWFPGTAGEALGLIVFNLGLAIWALIPLYDNKRAWGLRARIASYIGLAALALLVLTTVWGYLALD